MTKSHVWPRICTLIPGMVLLGCAMPGTHKTIDARAGIVDQFVQIVFVEGPGDVEEYAESLSAGDKREVAKRLGDAYRTLSDDDRGDCIEALWMLDNDDANETLAKILGIERNPEISCTAANILISRGRVDAFDHYIRALSPKTTWRNYDDKMAWLYCLAGLIEDMHMFDKRLIPILIANIDANSEAGIYFAAQCSTMMQLITNTLPRDINVVMEHEWELQKSPQKVQEAHDRWAEWWEENKATFRKSYQPKATPRTAVPPTSPK